MAKSQKMIPIKKPKKNKNFFLKSTIINNVPPMRLHITAITLEEARFKKLKPGYLRFFLQSRKYKK